jgi:hypothetical protein
MLGNQKTGLKLRRASIGAGAFRESDNPCVPKPKVGGSTPLGTANLFAIVTDR